MSGPTVSAAWKDLLASEPRLADLLGEAQAVSSRGNPEFCANEVWVRDLKPRLVRLVGWFAESGDPALGSPMSYDVAYRTIYDALPVCRECGCL